MQSFGVRFVCKCLILIELCESEKKKEVRKKERGKKEEKNKIDIFTFDFLDCEEKSWNSGVTFYIRIAKGFHL